MTEMCFCGWFGDLADKESVLIDEGKRALCCPQCGGIDDLVLLAPAARHRLSRPARERRIPRELVAPAAA